MELARAHELNEMPTEILFAIVATLSPRDLLGFSIMSPRFWNIAQIFLSRIRSLQLFLVKEHRLAYLRALRSIFTNSEMTERSDRGWLDLFAPRLNQPNFQNELLCVIKSELLPLLFENVEQLEVHVTEPMMDVHYWLTSNWSAHLTALTLNTAQADWSLAKYQQCFNAIDELPALRSLHLFYIRQRLPEHWGILGRLREFTLQEYHHYLEPVFAQFGAFLRRLRLGRHQQLLSPTMYFNLLQGIHEVARHFLSHLTLAFVTESLSVSLLAQFSHTFEFLRFLDLSNHYNDQRVSLSHLTAVLQHLPELTELKIKIESLYLPEVQPVVVDGDESENEENLDSDSEIEVVSDMDEDIEIDVEMIDDDIDEDDGEEMVDVEGIDDNEMAIDDDSDSEDIDVENVSDDDDQDEMMNQLDEIQNLIHDRLAFLEIIDPLQITSIFSLRTLHLAGGKGNFRNFARWDLLRIAFPLITQLNFNFCKYQNPEIDGRFLLTQLQQRIEATFGKQVEVTMD